MSERCGESKAPKNWFCTRDAGHDGPCAARLKKVTVKWSSRNEYQSFKPRVDRGVGYTMYVWAWFAVTVER